MKKKIAILGSTGSIGEMLLDIIEKDKKNFEIILLTADKNYKELLKQSELFKVKNIIIKNKESFIKFKKINKKKNIKIYNTYENFNKIFKNKTDYVMSSITGIDGLDPTLKIIKFTKKIAIANKESLICGWNLIHKQLKKNNTQFMPVDSEHFSIWYALKNLDKKNIDKIILTASGGALLNFSEKKINKIKIKDVLNHPNWKMGKKITVDSSTMMNKVFELIEARNIFNVSLSKLSILIHPKSYIHAIIIFKNGMIKLIAHETTMEIPIYNSLYGVNSNYFKKTNLNTNLLNNLNLSKLYEKKFKMVNTLKLIPKKPSLFETVLVASNDELVRMYLNNKIKYKNIYQRLYKILTSKEFIKFKKILPKNVSQITNLDHYVRFKINTKSV